ncbi:glycoside hydrolase family 78 protein [Pedobacter sp. SYP-B3415]|uniref:glycoside hydrolase family 78 protein n=1 Tax=Pedobacter sp. SYP-B3415 TaxID=2496641 RepID=UPI00101CCCA3|nr:glycoside hydrolase family 78 protein [Pedobacter sp. SYP-B3415]
MRKILSVFLIAIFASAAVLAQPEAGSLRCEGLINPEGLGTATPRFSWRFTGGGTDLRQQGYQIMVAGSAEKLAANEADIWDSGRVRADLSHQVKFAGKALKSRQRVFWKVRAWTTDGETQWSEPASFSLGLLFAGDWKGRWIGLDRSFSWDSETQFSRLSARYFRKEILVKKKLRRATAYIIGLGLYEGFINGKKLGDQVLAPVPTDYSRSVAYNTFTLEDKLHEGKNTIGIILGNGRYYTMRQAYKPYKIKTFGYPKLLVNIDLDYIDGSSETITTDDSWRVTADGPIRSNNEYDGEIFDARKSMPGWNVNGFDDRKWLKAEFVQEPGGMPVAQTTPGMKVTGVLQPAGITRTKSGTYILDIGQNIAGWIRMRVKGQAGQQVTLRFAESLNADGSLYTENLRDAKSSDQYTLRGGARETWNPTFVYHGFRFVEVTGYPGVPRKEDFDACVVHDAVTQTGNFLTDNKVINQVYRNAVWGIRGNYKGMPVDCPQRNERQPWLGDRSTGAYGEAFVFDNAGLYAKWLNDIRESQRADGSIPDVAPAFWRYYSDNVTWPGTYLQVADMLLTHFDDEVSLRDHYPAMKKWIDYMWTRYADNELVKKDKYGDWCVPPEAKELIHAKDPARLTDGGLIAAATYYHLLTLMQKFAERLGEEQDLTNFRDRATRTKEAFNKTYFDAGKHAYGNGTVTAQLLPLAFDMVSLQERAEVFGTLVNRLTGPDQSHISTGVIGTQYLMRTLSRFGRTDLAYRLATNTGYPSWGYMAENGATTIWELWNGNTASPKMNSQNHVMLLGDLLIWYYENLAGIRAAQPGYKEIEMKPEPVDGLNTVQASLETPYGTVRSEWKRTGNKFQWQVTVPPNSEAKIYVPAARRSAVSGHDKNNKEQKFDMERDRAVFTLGSGTYVFSSEISET